MRRTTAISGETPPRYAEKTWLPPSLNAGANPNSDFHSDGSLLHSAVQSNDLAVVAALLNAKANPNAQNELGKTPLHYAAASTSPVEETLLVILGGLQVQDWYWGWDAVQEADHQDR